MELKIIEGPSIEPITYKEAKEQLRVDLDTEEDLIESYITAAREYCEEYQNRTYLTTKQKLILDKINFPVKIPRPPIQSVEKIEFQERDGTLIEWDSQNYISDTTGNFGWVRLAESYAIPDIKFSEKNILQITFISGFENAEDVPGRVKNAIKLLVTHWFENRVPVVIGTVSTEVELTVKALLGSDRVVNV